MFSLTVLILIQSLFCIFFFLYFRHKIEQHLKLKEYRQEIDEVITIFNRQAERHITYLEKLLDNDVFKNRPSLPPRTPPPLKETLPVEPEEKKEIKKSISPPRQPVISKTKSEPPTLPLSVAHAFYARFSQPEKKSLTPTSKKPSSPESVEVSDIKDQLQFRIFHLHNEGKTINQIAQHLSVSTVEVKLILKLKGKI